MAAKHPANSETTAAKLSEKNQQYGGKASARDLATNYPSTRGGPVRKMHLGPLSLDFGVHCVKITLYWRAGPLPEAFSWASDKEGFAKGKKEEASGKEKVYDK